jgi:hypothetical protein
VEKAKKNGKELETLVAEATEQVVGGPRAMPTVVEAHIRDGMGRNWDVRAHAPTRSIERQSTQCEMHSTSAEVDAGRRTRAVPAQ